MYRTSTLNGAVAALLCVGLCGAADSGQAQVNLAKGKPYRLSPRPNYGYCTDPGDATQLTDGVYTKGYFWTQPTTVGWTNANPATIRIDLGKVEPIGGVSYNTAAGVAGVQWPLSILILVSDDGKGWHFAGDLVGLSAAGGGPPASGYAVHKYRTDKLHARGRYVTLMIASPGPYVFCDEIEVFRGPDDLLKSPPAGEKVADLKAFYSRIQVTACVRRRLRADLADVERAVQGAQLEPDARKGLLDNLQALDKSIAGAEVEAAAKEDFRTVFPLNELHAAIFRVQAHVWRSASSEPVAAWQKNRWDMLSPTEPPGADKASVDVAMMRGEYRAAAFNLSNASDGEAAVEMRLRDLPAEAERSVQFCEVPFTDTRSGVPVAAAMPEATRKDFREKAWVVRIPPGLTRQVWLTFHTDSLGAGEYAGKIDCACRCLPPGAKPQECTIPVPLRLKVYPVRFPKAPALHLCGWDYTDRDRCYNVTPANRDAFIRMLREYFVDTPWAQRAAMPDGTHDKTGHMTAPPDDASFRTWLKRWPDARVYMVFLSMGPRFAGFEMGTPQFRKAVGEWAAWWVGRAKELGLKPRQLGVLLVDEPHSPEQARTIIEYAKVIRAAAPDIVIWEDPTWSQPDTVTPELFGVCDVLCPNRPMWIAGGATFANFYVRQLYAGRELWFYSCSGPGKLLDPYSYHRLQAWHCWKYGAKGMGYWAFGDSNGASSWNEYLALRGAYTPLFLDDRTVTRGKHMEAIREGVEDYEYLRMLQDGVAALDEKAPADPRLAPARKLLSTAADRVLACMTDVGQIDWVKPKDRGVADRVRVEVLEMLVKLGAP